MLVSRSRVAEKHHLFAKKFLFLIYLRLIGGQKKKRNFSDAQPFCKSKSRQK